MSKGKVYISNYPDNPPEWYWISGLHDACIIGTESFEFPSILLCLVLFGSREPRHAIRVVEVLVF